MTSQIHFWQSVAARMSLMQVMISSTLLMWVQSFTACSISFSHRESSCKLHPSLASSFCRARNLGSATTRADRQARVQRTAVVFMVVVEVVVVVLGVVVVVGVRNGVPC